jgi:4-amino-4-deoxy-L-arabinose transferase-like glycosyltransferase
LRYNLGSRRAATPLKYFLLGAVAAGLVLRFAKLGGQSLWVDEVITLENAFPGQHVPFARFLGTLQGPLVEAIMHFWASLSSNDAFLRIPFAVAGAMTVLAIYLLAKSLYDSWATLHTVFVASLSPILIWYSQEIRGYAFVVLFAVLGTYFFIQWLARPTARNAFYYGLMLFAGLVSNLSAVFIAAAHFAYLILTSGKRKLLGKWIVTVFVVLLVFSPWVREIIDRTEPQGTLVGSAEPMTGGGDLSLWALPYSLFTYSVGYTLGPSIRDIQADRVGAVTRNIGWILLTVAVFGIPLVVGVNRLARTNRNLLSLLVVWFLVPIVGVSLLAVLGVKVFNVRYALVGLPAYILLVGPGLAGISRTRFWGFAGLFTALVGFSICNYFLVPAYGKEDPRDAARTIRAAFHQGDVVVGVYTAEGLKHYLNGFTAVNVFEAADLTSKDAMAARCRQVADGAPRVWLSLCREWLVDPSGTIKGWFDDNMELVMTKTVPGIRLILYQRRSE